MAAARTVVPDPSPERGLSRNRRQTRIPSPTQPKQPVPGNPLPPGDDGSGKTLYHYTNASGGGGIAKDQCLRTNIFGEAFVSPDFYPHGWTAKDRLVIKDKPVDRRLRLDGTTLPGSKGPYERVEGDFDEYSKQFLHGGGNQLVLFNVGQCMPVTILGGSEPIPSSDAVYPRVP